MPPRERRSTSNRPPDIAEAELVQFLEGLPQRYLTLFDAASIYQHVRLWRNIGPDDVHSFLSRKGEAWELTVVTLDKPYLFSNICGALASLGVDILRGQALTSRSGLVLDVFQFADGAGPSTPGELERLLSDVVAGRVDIPARLAEQPSVGVHTAGRGAAAVLRQRLLTPVHRPRARDGRRCRDCCTGSAARFRTLAVKSTSC